MNSSNQVKYTMWSTTEEVFLNYICLMSLYSSSLSFAGVELTNTTNASGYCINNFQSWIMLINSYDMTQPA